jgi:hypothetical protein
MASCGWKSRSTRSDVLVILDEQPAESRTAGEWPPGYLDSTIGKWQGDFVCESEGPFEHREPL